MEERYDPTQPDNKCGIATFDFFRCSTCVVYPYTEKGQGLFKWLGISTAAALPLNAMFCILAGFLAALFLLYMWLYRSGNLNYQGFTVDAFRQTGWSIETSAVILIWAIVQTSVVGGNPVPGISL